MSVFNESLEGRFNRGVQRLHNLKAGAGAIQVAPELQHTIQIDRFDPDAWAIFDRWPWVGRTQEPAGGAGTFAMVGVRNPTNSGILVVVEGCAIMPAMAGSTVELRTAIVTGNSAGPQPGAAAPGGGNGTCFFRDARARTGLGGGCPVLITFRNDLLVNTGNGPLDIATGQTTAERPIFKSFPYVLPPGGYDLYGVNTATNGLCDLMFWGYFRPLVPGDALA